MAQTRADDMVLLELLDGRDRLGLRGTALRAHMERITRDAWSNGRLQGALGRLARDELPCACVKPENQDGGMPERWWE